MPLASPTIHRFSGRTPDTAVLIGGAAPYGDGYATDFNQGVNGNATYRAEADGNIYLEFFTGATQSGAFDFTNNDSKFLQTTFDFWLTSHVASAVLLGQFRHSTAAFSNLLLSLTSGVTTFRARGSSDGALVNTSAVSLALNTKYIVRTIIHTGTASTADGKMRVQLLRKSDGAVLYDQENTAQSFNGVNTRGANMGKLGNITGGVCIDNWTTWDSAYTFLEPLADTIYSAGSDQTSVEPFSTVTLVGTASGSAPSTWPWTQTAGPAVTLNGTGATRTFTAPAVRDGTVVSFSLGGDTVDIYVNKQNAYYKNSAGLLVPQQPIRIKR